MRKFLFTIALLVMPLLLPAQTENNQYYIYNIVNFSGFIDSEDFTLEIDNGKEITTLKDKDGDKIKFKTPAAALMYLTAEGWELYTDGVANFGDLHSAFSTFYWIIRKPCTKEEFEKESKAGVIVKKK